MEKSKEELVELECMVCGFTWMGEPLRGCCSGRDCGCMGLPINPPICSPECYEKGLNKKDMPTNKTYVLSIHLAVMVEAEDEKQAQQIEYVKVVGEQEVCKVVNVDTISTEISHELE